MNTKKTSETINFFSFVKKDDEEIMGAIFGREKIRHQKATLPGYELCIQTAKNIIDEIIHTCKLPISPRQILTKKRGPNFELFTIRPHKTKSIEGEVWYVTPEEYERLRDYELIDCGMSEDILAKAVTDKGETITVHTYGLKTDTDNITKVIVRDYKRPEISKEEKIKTATDIRKEN